MKNGVLTWFSKVRGIGGKLLFTVKSPLQALNEMAHSEVLQLGLKLVWSAVVLFGQFT